MTSLVNTKKTAANWGCSSFMWRLTEEVPPPVHHAVLLPLRLLRCLRLSAKAPAKPPSHQCVFSWCIDQIEGGGGVSVKGLHTERLSACVFVCMCVHGRASNTSVHHCSVQRLCNGHMTTGHLVIKCGVKCPTWPDDGTRRSDLWPPRTLWRSWPNTQWDMQLFLLLSWAEKSNFRVRLRWNRDACVI